MLVRQKGYTYVKKTIFCLLGKENLGMIGKYFHLFSPKLPLQNCA